jgi:hypothetical protein
MEVPHGQTAKLKCAAGKLMTGFWGIRYGNPSKKCSSPLAER